MAQSSSVPQRVRND
ncbi:unnamed protein product, partial [Diplocarpon coronariae]